MTQPHDSPRTHAPTHAHAATPQAPLTEADVSARLRGAPDRMLDVGHAQLAYYRFGAGPDLVCVHGWPLHAATWRRIVPLLAGDFTLHLLDLPGTGQSVWDAGSRIDLGAHGESVRRATELLGLERFAYLAHDSGAAISRLAAADDTRVFAHVMADTEIPGHVPWQIKVLLAALRVPPLFRAMLRAMRFGPVRRSPLGFGGCFTDARYVDGDFGTWFVEPLVTDMRVLEGHTRLLASIRPEDLTDVAETHATLRSPSLLIWGPRDPFFPIAMARAMVPQFTAGAELIELPDASIFPHEDHPEAFAAATRAFLLRHAPSA